MIRFSRCVASHRPSPQPTEMSSLRRVSPNCYFFSLSDAPQSSSFAKCEQSLPSSDRQGAHSLWKSGFRVNCKRHGKGVDHSASKTLILNTLGLHLKQVLRCLLFAFFWAGRKGASLKLLNGSSLSGFALVAQILRKSWAEIQLFRFKCDRICEHIRIAPARPFVGSNVHF